MARSPDVSKRDLRSSHGFARMALYILLLLRYPPVVPYLVRKTQEPWEENIEVLESITQITQTAQH